MRAINRGKAAVAAALAMGLALVGAPAFAAPGDYQEPVLTVANTTFESGTWGGGIEFSVTNVPADVDEVYMTIGAAYAGGGGPGEGVLMAAGAAAGEFTGTLVPEGAPAMPDAQGYPVYTAMAYYKVVVDGQDYPDEVYSNLIELEIVEGMTVTGPETATGAELAAGVALQFKGFQANETLTGEIEFYDGETEESSVIGEFSAVMGADGSGSGTLTVTNAPVGSWISVVAHGQNGEVSFGLRVVAADNGGGNGGATPPTTPKKPESVETGVL